MDSPGLFFWTMIAFSLALSFISIHVTIQSKKTLAQRGYIREQIDEVTIKAHDYSLESLEEYRVLRENWITVGYNNHLLANITFRNPASLYLPRIQEIMKGYKS